MPISTAVDPSAVARVLGIKEQYVDLRGGAVVYLPQRVAVFGQGSSSVTYSTTKYQPAGHVEVAEKYGWGSPLHLMVKELLPDNGDGVGLNPVTVYPLAEPGTSAPATIDVAPTGTATANGTFRPYINDIPGESFVIRKGEAPATYAPNIAAAINANTSLPVTAAEAAAVVTCTSKWEADTANGINIRFDGPTDIGVDLTSTVITHNNDGAGTPDVTAAIAQIGNVWESMLINSNLYTDTTTLDEFETFGVGRWGPVTKKPLMVFTGATEATRATMVAAGDARRTDRVNSILNAPGSDGLPFMFAARCVARAAKLAGSNPPFDYARQKIDTIEPGTDAEQWDGTSREIAVKAGISTITVEDGVIYMSDTVTTYHPSGVENPPYRYVVDIVKLQNAIFNLNLLLDVPKYDGAPLIPDDEFAPENPSAIKPKDIKGVVYGWVDGLADAAIVVDRDWIKDTVVCQISSTNPKRCDVSVTLKLVGNSNIISVDLNWGFYFGGAVAA